MLKLNEIVGQPQIARLPRLFNTDKPRCLLFDGDGGIGKSATAYALADALGATDDWEGYLKVIPASELSIEACRDLFEQSLRLRRANWKVVVIEELDGVASKAVERYIKVALDPDAPAGRRLPERTLVIATSNNAAALPHPVRQRFIHLAFSSGPEFAEACQNRIATLWEAENIGPVPQDWKEWGWYTENGTEKYSMRLAMQRFEEEMVMSVAV